MAWRTTEEAPSIEWRWDPSDTEMFVEEEEACRKADEWIRADNGKGLAGLRLLELGCGRGACLRFGRDVLGAGRLTGVDRATGAIQAAMAHLRGLAAVRLVQDDACATRLQRGAADVVWSHGVVEHFRPTDAGLGAYVREACRLAAGGYVALSAPNPASPGYAAFRDLLLAEERWLWGYEEPLASYAPWLTAAGATVLRDEAIGGEWQHVDPYARQLPADQQAAIRARCDAGIEPGVYTLIVAKVPV